MCDHGIKPEQVEVPTITLPVSNQMALTAYFIEADKVVLDARATLGGTINLGTHFSTTYTRGETVTLTATPDSGYRLFGWDQELLDGSLIPLGNANPLQVLMDDDKSIVANFGPDTDETLTVSAFGSGTISPPPGDHIYANGTTVTVTVTPAAGWTVAANSPLPAGPTDVLMDFDKSVGAIFVPAVNDPEMVYVNGDTFTMGTSYSGSEYANTHPEHDVTLQMYFIGKYEITCTQYAQMLNYAQGHGYLQDASGAAYSMSTGGAVYVAGKPALPIGSSSYPPGVVISAGQFGPYTDWGTRPVIHVTWYGAAAYCNWLSESRGLTSRYNTSTWALEPQNGYRLPTEAEWDHAAGWNPSTPRLVGRWKYAFYGWPNWWSPINAEECNYGQNIGTVTPVGYYNGVNPSTDNSTSPWGCYDMSGNASEWCQDFLGSYPSTPQTNPFGPLTGTYRVLRGGDFKSPEIECRTYMRMGDDPGFLGGSRGEGFRIALGSPPVN